MTEADFIGLPPGFYFLPTDVEVVVHYLLRRIRGEPLPVGDILDDDPLSEPPWLLLSKHGRKDDAFFFAEGQAMNGKGSRQKRSCKGGGTWEGQGQRKAAKGGEGEKLRVRVDGEEIEWRKYALNFHEEATKGKRGSTGWVMHEYSITSPPELAASLMRVYRIRFSGHGRNAQKRKRNEVDWASDEEEEVYRGAAPPAVSESDALFVGGYRLAPQPEPANYLSVPVASDSDALLVGGCPSAPQPEPDSYLAMLGESDAVIVGGRPSAPQPEPDSYLSMVPESDALFVGGCPSVPKLGPVSYVPVAPVDVGNVNLAEWTGAGAGGALTAGTSSSDQDLPALVDGGDEDWNFTFSMDDLLPGFDFYGAAGVGDISAPMVPAA